MPSTQSSSSQASVALILPQCRFATQSNRTEFLLRASLPAPTQHKYTGLTECQVNFVRKDHLIDNVSSLITGVITRAVIN